jgi:D-alanyl-D-alanine carboxypeptidase (penicillin-binding protein 5/6)
MNKLLAVLLLVVGGLLLPVYATAGQRLYSHHTAAAGRSDSGYQAVAIPVQLSNPPASLLDPTVSAYAVDTTTMTPLYAQGATTPRAIASITKLMTVMVVLSDHTLNSKVTVGQLPAYDPSDETLGLTKGQVFTVEALTKAALIPSDNDAADALAIYDAGSLKAFITKMNAKLTEWGIVGAHFNSAEGLTDTNNYASAEALAKIAKLALVNRTIATIVRLPTANISDGAGQTYSLTTTDDLLASGRFYGIKTGYTDAAGQCFVGLAHVNGHDVITVVLHSSDRFGDTMRLLNWIQGAWQWQ